MSKRWTFEEDQIILNSIDNIDEVYDQLPNRSIASIKSRANVLKREEEKRKFIESWDKILYSDIVGYDAEVPENFKDNFDTPEDATIITASALNSSLIPHNARTASGEACAL